MKNKIILAILISTLFLASSSANAINITTNKDDYKNIFTNNSNPRVMEIADLIIDSVNTEATIVLHNLVLDLIIPDGETIIPVEFKFNCKIENEKLLNTETWVFKVEMRKYPAGSYIINEKIIKNDTLIEGYPWEKTISATVDFSRDYPWEERGATNIYEQKYSLNIRCEYYDDGVKPGEQAPDDHDVKLTDPVVVLKNNDNPTKPNIVSSDIKDGDKKGRGTYNITVKSTDPDGDKIRYTFMWGDRTSSCYPGSGYVKSGTQATCSHTYGDDHELNDYDIKIFVMDKFGGMSDVTTISFTLPKANSFTSTRLIQILKINLPQVYELLKNYIS